ncbi:DUF4294 domain-containing protein [Lutibacter sp.]|uniref:DUF4294 domain-containing protein n=1 Tax=Lutibacter sp. TaxID=1925666 RepID=UPI0025B85AA2|nr:DUF4294 domain-containing protein [Lutibacter sp.]MCF6182954.1 DUF4294 domain-containing protein [Lutibacter sp.]
MTKSTRHCECSEAIFSLKKPRFPFFIAIMQYITSFTQRSNHFLNYKIVIYKIKIYVTLLPYIYRYNKLIFKSKYILPFLVVLVTNVVFSQEEPKTDSIPLNQKYIIFKGDTLLIKLHEVQLLKKLNFKTNYDRRYYFWFRKKVLKAYPYAKLGTERLTILNERLSKIKSKRQKRKYTKLIQKYMEGEFTIQLKKLTRMEGRILIKLIDRQTGDTAFHLVKNLRSGWKAFWYNTTANIFKLSLKDIYDPVNNKEDFLIEDILQRAFINGVLEEQPSKLNFNYLELSKKWMNAPKPPLKKH